MLKVGLTGGLACGKSAVGAELQRLGCHLIQADALGHAVLAPGGEAYAPVVQLFGTAILSSEGSIDRRKLAGIVFADATKLEQLNALVHPAVWKREQAIFQEIAARDKQAIVVVEAAILIETGTYRNFDKLIVVVCGEAQQRQRALARPGAIPEDVDRRLASQMPISTKRTYGDYVIDSSGTLDDTLRQTRHVYESLSGLLENSSE
jgi:dephospho-CoA kinase